VLPRTGAMSGRSLGVEPARQSRKSPEQRRQSPRTARRNASLNTISVSAAARRQLSSAGRSRARSDRLGRSAGWVTSADSPLAAEALGRGLDLVSSRHNVAAPTGRAVRMLMRVPIVQYLYAMARAAAALHALGTARLRLHHRAQPPLGALASPPAPTRPASASFRQG